MTTVRKTAAKDVAAKPVKPAKVTKESTEERLEGLIAFLKKHGIHYEEAAVVNAAPEPATTVA